MKKYDTVVIGAGPAGLSAAIEVSKAGGSIAVVDGNQQPGGQLIKQIHKFFGSAQVCAGTRGIRLAQILFQQAQENGCEFTFGYTVYAIEAAPGGFYTVFAGNGQETVRFEARTIVLALGASENAIAFKGWTKPGVITAGAAQTMVNLQRIRCADNVLMVGAGNVGLIVSYQLMQAGIHVEAIIEAAGKIGGYAVHANKIRRMGVPVLTSHTIVEARGRDSVEEAVIAQADYHFQPVPGTERVLAVDTVCLAVGLSPLIKLAQIAGCRIIKNGDRSEPIVWHDANMMTSCPGIFVAGDVCGVEEASIAMEEGAIAGLSVGKYLGIYSMYTIMGSYREHLARIEQIREIGKQELLGTDLSPYEGLSSPKVLIECCQEIPCNPCEKSCPVGAIQIGKRMSSRPKVDLNACIGCGRCVAMCPGQACFLLNLNAAETEAEIALPYELLPVPKKGALLAGLNRDGKKICTAEVVKVITQKEFDQTYVLFVRVPKQHAQNIRAVASEGGIYA